MVWGCGANSGCSSLFSCNLHDLGVNWATPRWVTHIAQLKERKKEIGVTAQRGATCPKPAPSEGFHSYLQSYLQALFFPKKKENYVTQFCNTTHHHLQNKSATHFSDLTTKIQYWCCTNWTMRAACSRGIRDPAAPHSYSRGKARYVWIYPVFFQYSILREKNCNGSIAAHLRAA